MSRFVDNEEGDYPNAWALWRQAQRNALRGRKGQAVLRELEAALVAMPEKRLVEGSLCQADGAVCALGALGRYRGVPDEEMNRLDGDDAYYVSMWAADALGVVEAWATAVQYANDEGGWPHGETAEQRYERMLGWVRGRLAVAS